MIAKNANKDIIFLTLVIWVELDQVMKLYKIVGD